MLSTTFNLLTGGWADQPEDFPLYYRFLRGTQSVSPVTLVMYSLSSTASVQLPQGSGQNDILAVSVLVKDSLGAETGTADPVDVSVSAPVLTLAEQNALVVSTTAEVMSSLAVGDRSGTDAITTLSAIADVIRNPCDNVTCSGHGECEVDGNNRRVCVCWTGYSGDDCEVAPVPIHGRFSPWSDWSNCSVTCGPGNRSRTRTCTNPAPAQGGRPCPTGVGPDGDYRVMTEGTELGAHGLHALQNVYLAWVACLLERKDVCVIATIHYHVVVLIAALWDLRWKRDIAIPIHAHFHPNYVLEAHEMPPHLRLTLCAMDMGLVKVCLPVLFVGPILCLVISSLTQLV